MKPNQAISPRHQLAGKVMPGSHKKRTQGARRSATFIQKPHTEERTLVLDGLSLTPELISCFVRNPSMRVAVKPETLEDMRASRDLLLQRATEQPIYGVNTGFGPMVRHIIGAGEIVELQYNLLRGHAVGMGDPVPERFVLAAMLVRLNTLAKGHSGVSAALAEKFVEIINHRIIPVVPEHGAVGTSGDLVQLAHIAITLIGEGEVFYHGVRRPTADVFRECGIKPHVLGPKEGLSLINGTSMMTGIGALLVLDAKRLIGLATRNGALALELVHAFTDILDPALHGARPHSGQQDIARHVRELTADSKLLSEREDTTENIAINDSTYETSTLLQEVYSLRCTPQVLGPILETITRTSEVIRIEMNSVTDNPIIDVETGRFLHGGNFHGDYVATAVDQLKAGLVKLTMLSERRVNFFLNKDTNKTFPPFLNLVQPGLTMGLQGLQFVATSTTAQSQSLGFPHSLHSIPTNGDNQDIVSMGTDAALIAHKVIQNAYIVLGIELVALSQATEATKAEDGLSTASWELVSKTRSIIPTIHEDRNATPELNALVERLAHDNSLIIR